MSVEKAEIKIGTIKGIGNKLDDIREGVAKERSEHDGAVTAYKAAVPMIEALFKHVDTDIDEGKVPEDGALATAKYAKTYIRRAADVLNNLRITSVTASLQAQGKLAGLDASILVAKKEVDAEIKKIEALAAALGTGTLTVEDDDVPERPVGVHPGNPIADRKAEEPADSGEDSEEEEIDLDSMGRDDLLALADEREVKIDKRWSLTRLRRALEDELYGEDT